MQDLLNNLELAVRDIINAGSLGVTIFLGQDSHTQLRPSITIYAQQGDERPVGSGNFLSTVMVQIRSSASANTQEEHRKLCRDVLSLIEIDNLGSVMSGLANLTVYDPVVNVRGSQGIEDDSWLTEHQFDAYCCLLDIA